MPETAKAEKPQEAPQEYPIMVLLVDDQAMIGEAIRRALSDQPSMRFHYCSEPADAIDVAESIKPTVILQDLVMPGVDGLTLVRRYRANEHTRDIPIIVLSTKEEPSIKSAAFAEGANDYLVKLPDRIELIARIRHHSKAYLNQLQRDEAYRALRESQKQLVETNIKLQRLTNVDGLTGLNNRRYFDEYLDMEWRRAAREGKPLSLLMVDVDAFKTYNDTYGHLAGDETLKSVAVALQRGCERPADLAARFGGEEFVVVLPGSGPEAAAALGEKLRRVVEELGIPHGKSPTADHITVSIGAASALPSQRSSPVALVEAADKALYEAKRLGRNRLNAAQLA